MTATTQGHGLRAVAENIQVMLFRLDINQGELGRRVGIASGTMSRKMNRASDWTFTEAQAIARELHVTLDELAGDLPDFDTWAERVRHQGLEPRTR